MSITEQQRHQLFTWFEEAMGSERAATMMDLLPPVGWADVATKPDVVRLERDLRDLREDVQALRFEVREMGRSQITWLLMSQATVVAVMILIAVFFAVR